jgi:hypothetical protein
LVCSHLLLVLQNCLLFAISLTKIVCVYLIFIFPHRSLSLSFSHANSIWILL